MKIFDSNCCEKLLNYRSDNKIRRRYFLDDFGEEVFSYVRNELELAQSIDFDLDPAPESDYINSVQIHRTFNNVTLAQANDRRFWVTLTHKHFFKYTKLRWKICEDDSSEKILRRFHFEGTSIEARVRNSISRLWFAASLTFHENENDKYAMTKFFWSKQDLFQYLMERSYGSYDCVMKGFLEFYRQNSQLSEERLRLLFTGLNARGGVQPLSLYSSQEIKDLIEELNDYYNKGGRF